MRTFRTESIGNPDGRRQTYQHTDSRKGKGLERPQDEQERYKPQGLFCPEDEPGNQNHAYDDRCHGQQRLQRGDSETEQEDMTQQPLDFAPSA